MQSTSSHTQSRSNPFKKKIAQVQVLGAKLGALVWEQQADGVMSSNSKNKHQTAK